MRCRTILIHFAVRDRVASLICLEVAASAFTRSRNNQRELAADI
jgi:hypothetical protein